MRATLTIASLLLSAAATAGTTHYSILFSGTQGGEQVTTVTPDGRIEVTFHYLENGRGPKLRENMQLAEDGTLLRYRVTGTSTFGAPISESFARRADEAEWKSHSDQGRVTLSQPAIYVPVESSYETSAVIARALARQAGKTLAALPGGKLGIEKLATTRLQSGDREVRVALLGKLAARLRHRFSAPSCCATCAYSIRAMHACSSLGRAPDL